MPLAVESMKYTTINTHVGFFQYTRFCCGIASSPAMIQRVMDTLIRGIPRVCGYLDYILITGKTELEHDTNLRTIIRRLQEAGIRVKEEKCNFKEDKVQYLGYIINKYGLRPVEAKVYTIRETPRPTNTTQLRGYLGILNYYGRFTNTIYSLFMNRRKD